MPKVNRKPDPERAGKSLAQSVLLPKDWSREKVDKWLKDHDFIASGIDEPGEDAEFWRARQYDPEHFTRFAVQPLPGSGGVRIVLGVVKGQRKDSRIGTSRVEYGMVIDAVDADDGPWAIRLADGSLLLNHVPIMRECVNSYGTRREYKSWDDVKDAAPTFEDATITYLHPEERMVDAESFRSVSRGHIKGPFIEDENNRIVWGKAHIADAELIEEVLAKRALGVSPGFFCEPFDEPGQAPDGTAYDGRQLFMTGNHFAFGPTEQWARGGPQMQVALDGNGDVILGAKQASDSHNKEAEVPEKRTIVFDGKAYELTDVSGGFEDALNQFKAEQTKLVTDANAQRDEALGKLAAAQKERDELKARLDAATSPAEVAKAAQARATLIEQARTVSGNQQFTSDGDELTVMTEALKAGGNDTSVVDGKDEGFRRGYITATFHRIANTNASEQKAITDAWSPDPNQKPPKGNPPPGGGGNGQQASALDGVGALIVAQYAQQVGGVK